MPLRALVTVVAIALGSSAPARAWVLDEDPLAETSTTLGAILRSFHFLLAGGILPDDSDPAARSVFDARLYAVRSTPSFKLVLHHQLAVESGALGLEGVGRGLPPPRWLPLTFEHDDDDARLRSSTDWLYASYNHGRATITAGRQPITFGRGAIWRPIDLVIPFAVTEVDTEYKPGADAVRIDWSPLEGAELTALVAVGEVELERDHDFDISRGGSVGLVRARYGHEAFDLGAIGGFVRGDGVAGIDGSYDLAPVRFYGEATLTLVGAHSPAIASAEVDDWVAKAVLGAQWQPHSDLTISPELWHNGFGASDAADYLAIATSPRVAIGEEVVLGRDYGAVIASWQAHPLWTIGGASLVNLRDPSALLSVSASYDVAGNVRAVIGGYLSVGEGPDPGGAWQSEFGALPGFAFAELAATL